MKKIIITAEKKCPQCGKVENQIKKGFNSSGTQRCKCKECGVVYTINPKKREYPEETKKLAMKMYYSDGWLGYVDVVYPGKYTRNVHNKNDTFTVEGINADLRHYVPILARRSRCFPRTLETLQAVVAVFVDAYNQFGIAKMNFRRNKNKKSRELPFSLVDFL